MKTMIRAFTMMAVTAGVLAAQNPPAGGPPRPPRGMPGGAPDRAQLEQRIRERIGDQVKRNLNLSDEQFAKLQATNKRFEEKRRLLVEQERDARMAMRDLMINGDTTNQGKVSQALDRLLAGQRQRFELVEQEQKELAGFLTPMQRARYLGMQEQMFRRMEAMRQQRGMGPNGPPMGPGMQPGMQPGMGMQPGQRMRVPRRPPSDLEQPGLPPLE